MPLLFSYGTLQNPEVQLETFKRPLTGRADALPAYRRAAHGPHANAAPDPHATLHGAVFEVTEEELLLADAYEAPANYRRIRVTLKSGVEAWVYVHAD